MNNKEVKQYLVECWSELKDISGVINATGQFEKKTLYLTQYAIIRCCGTLELSYKTILAGCAGYKLCSRTESYLEYSVVGNSMNPSLNNIVRLANRFDKSWGKQLEKAINGYCHANKTKRAITALVTLRNNFAHGQSAATSFRYVKNYFVEACRILKFLDDIVGRPHNDPEYEQICNELKPYLELKLITVLKKAKIILAG